jgi:hypothetical protein
VERSHQKAGVAGAQDFLDLLVLGEGREDQLALENEDELLTVVLAGNGIACVRGNLDDAGEDGTGTEFRNERVVRVRRAIFAAGYAVSAAPVGVGADVRGPANDVMGSLSWRWVKNPEGSPNALVSAMRRVHGMALPALDPLELARSEPSHFGGLLEAPPSRLPQHVEPSSSRVTPPDSLHRSRNRARGASTNPGGGNGLDGPPKT